MSQYLQVFSMDPAVFDCGLQFFQNQLCDSLPRDPARICQGIRRAAYTALNGKFTE